MKRLLIILILGILFSSYSYADPDSIALTNRIIFLERKLDSHRYSERLNACRELEELPQEATEILVKRYPQLKNSRLKSLMLKILTNRKYEGIQKLIIDEFPYLLENKDTLLKILLRTPKKSFNLLKFQLFENPSRSDRQPVIEAVYREFIKRSILEIFRNYFDKVYKSTKYGFYENDFKLIQSYGEEGANVVAQIAHYDPLIKNDLNFYNISYIRMLAVRVLALQQHPDLINLIKQSESFSFINGIRIEIQIALFHLENNLSILREINQKKEAAFIGSTISWKFMNWVEAGMLYTRIGKFDNAISMFNTAATFIANRIKPDDLDSQRENFCALYINLAEIYTIKQDFNKVSQSLDALLSYYNDQEIWEFIFNNRNLQDFWDSDLFLKWITNKRSEKFSNFIPDKTPGYLFQK